MNIYDFIKERPYLVWYVNNFDALDEESILEHTLNYGEFEDIEKLFEIMTINKAANIFRKTLQKKRNNYNKKVKNYFTLYFDKYAPRST